MADLTWFHFSDFHFRSADDFDRGRVLNALWQDIGKQLREGFLPDFIVITGDLAYSGKPAEYARAEREFLIPLLEQTGVSRKRVYFVPGNHDFDRDYLESLNPATIRGLKTRDQVNDLLSDPKKRNLYLQPFSAYSTFVRNFTTAEYFADSPAFSYCDKFLHGKTTVRIIGLNTSWACNYRSDAITASDKGQLLLGEYQLAHTGAPGADDTFTICAMHHPMDWLAEFEIAMLRQQILQTGQILHHGHVHLASEIAHTRARSHDCITLGAAASYDRRVGNDFYANGYSILTLSPSEASIKLRLRKYVDAPTPHWTSNEDVLGEGSKGQYDFALPSQNAPAQTHVASPSVVTSIDELCRQSRQLAAELPALRRLVSRFEPRAHGSTEQLLARYEELICAISSESVVPRGADEATVCAVSAILGQRVLQIAATELCGSAPHAVIRSLNQAIEEVSGALPTSLAGALAVASASWRAVIQRGDSTPYDLTQTEFAESTLIAAAAPVAAMVVLAASESNAAAEIIGIEPPRTESGIIVPPPRLLRARLQGATVVELTIPEVNAAQFVTLSLIRFHLESRIQKIVEAFASVNLVFGIQAVRLQLLQAPNTWTEQKFTVDTPRIIELLMGSELYGGHSKDIWFRELLQNSLDACASRKRIDDNQAYQASITMSYSADDKQFGISDNGLGMNRSHIEWYLCRIGRSIWRSEELTKQFKDKSLGKVSIGRFGVGFLSVFESASEVTLKTRHYREEAGHQLRITSPQEPFFVKEIDAESPGTEVQLRFAGGYEPNLHQLANRFLVYRPTDLTLVGVSDVPDNPEAALDREIRVGADDGLTWYRASAHLPSISATIYVAIPVLARTVADRREPFPTDSKVRLSNGGISVGETTGEWIGAEVKYSTPNSGVNGVRAILDFESGLAPVTVSRNGVKVSEADARQVIDMFARLCGDAWFNFAKDLFAEAGDPVAKTRSLLRALNRSAKTPGWRRTGWAEKEVLVKKAAGILKEFGSIEVQEEQTESANRIAKIGELAAREELVTITTAELAKSYLFQLYWRQSEAARLIVVPDGRSADLLQTCNSKWKVAKSAADIWELVEITEKRDFALCAFIPAEAAFVARHYFKDDSYFTAALPRKRARPQEVIGMSRSETADILPRVLLNCEHALWLALEKRLRDGEVVGEAISDALKMLLGLVIDEKSKTRREHEFRSVMRRFLGLAGLKSDTVAKIEYP